MAAEHRGSRDVIEDMMPTIMAPEDIAGLSDDRILAGMTKAIFQAGFNWKVIENKWPGFEEAFEGFVPVRWKFMSDEDLDYLLKDTRIVRNGMKIQTVRDNAIMLCDLEDEYGSAAKCIAEWPMTDFVGLLQMLHKRGSRLGALQRNISSASLAKMAGSWAVMWSLDWCVKGWWTKPRRAKRRSRKCKRPSMSGLRKAADRLRIFPAC